MVTTPQTQLQRLDTSWWGNTELIYKMYRAVGSSITFPAVNITAGTVYDLRTVSQRLLLTYHGIGGVRPPYQLRAEFYSTIGTFVLRNLTEDDSGTYQQVVNMTVVAVIELYVIEPLQVPTLRKANETRHGNQCYITLECRIQGSGPLNGTFLKDEEVITKNITRMGHAIYLSLDVWNPGSSGAYTCRLWNILENKTSPEIKIPTQDYDKCRNVILPLWAWIIISPVIFFIVIGVIYFTVKEYLKRREIQRSRDSTQNPPEGGQRNESYHNVPTNDPEDSAECETLEIDPRPSTEEEIPMRSDPGHCGQDGTPTTELRANGTASDYGQEAIG